MSTPSSRLQLARERAGFATATDAARRFGWNENTYRSHENGNRDISRKAASMYADSFKTSAGWILYSEGDEPKQSPLAPLPSRPPSNASEPVPTPRGGDDRIPILGVGRGGDDGRFELNGETIGYTMRPKSLIGVKGAYSIYVVGDSMEPRYEAGELVQVNPHKPPVPGRDVVVQIKPTESGVPGEGLIKEFVKRTPTYVVLRQYNPPKEIELEERIVGSVHLIVGRADE